jgi:hypothetical protein
VCAEAPEACRARQERDVTIAVLTLMVLIVAFGAEVGWLVVDPPAS